MRAAGKTAPYIAVMVPVVSRYQIILLGDRGTCVCEQLAQVCYLAVHQAAVDRVPTGFL